MPPGDRKAHPRYPGISVRETARHGKRYDVRVSTPDGRSLSRAFATLAEARQFQAERDRLRVTSRTGIDLERGSETLASHIQDWWDSYAMHRLEPTTRESHRRTIMNHIAPRLGHVELREITPNVVFRFQSDLQGATGASQVQRTMSVLSGILRRAVELGRIDRNPVSEIATPTARRLGVVRPLTWDQIEQIRRWLLNAGRPDGALYVSLMAFTGARPAEARAIRAGDIRWDAKAIDLLGRGTGAKRREGNKAGGGRAVPMLDALAHDLEACGVKRMPPGREVLSGPTGRPWTDEMHRAFASRQWRRACDELGIHVDGRTPRTYVLRHSHASWRIYEARWPDNEIAQMMGHDVRTLHEYYAHIIREASGSRGVDLELEIRRARDLHGTHPEGVELAELASKTFRVVVTDPHGGDPDRIRRLLSRAGLINIEITIAEDV